MYKNWAENGSKSSQWVPGTRDPNEGTQMLGPKYWDPNSQVWNDRVPPSWDPNEGTQILGPKCLDVNTVPKIKMHKNEVEPLGQLYGKARLG